MPLVAYTTTSSTSVPAVTISPFGAASYDTIMLSLGTDLYFKAESVYLYSTINAQILQPFQFEKYDVNGNIQEHPLTPAIDPYQKQNSLIYPIDFPAILDGKSQFNVTLLPLSNVTLIFYGIEFYVSDSCRQNNYMNLIQSAKSLTRFFSGEKTDMS